MTEKWVTSKLQELCTVFTDGDWIESKDQSEDGIRLIQTGNIGSGVFKDRLDKARYISEKTFKRLNCEEVFEGDMLISRLPEPVGRGCIIPEISNKAITAVDCTIIRINSELVTEGYLKYFIQSQQYQNKVNSRVTGTTRQRISRKNLGEITVVLPPLPVQKQIVEKLDAAFADIDKAISATQQNIENAKALFQSYLKIKFFELNQKEKSLKLEDISKAIFAGGDAPKSDFSKHKTSEYQIPVIANAVKDNGLYGFTNVARTEEHSVTIAARGSGTGHIEIREYPFFPIVRLIVVIPKLELITPKFLKYALESLTILSSGSAIPQLTVPMIKTYYLPVPDLVIQQGVLETLDSLLLQKKRLVFVQKNKLKELDSLKSSFLNQAFSGELTKEAA